MLISRKSVAHALTIATLVLTGVAIGIPDHASANDPACTVTGNTLNAAKRQFAQSCPGRVRKDCDPSGSRWQCSTESLPLKSSRTVNPAPTSPSTGTSNALLTIQAENATQTMGSGWSTERSLSGFTGSGYIVWRGRDDFRVSNSEPPAGIKAYDFTVRQAGTYQFTARVQARKGNGSAAFDKDNDAWVKFTSGSATAGVRGDASKWTKFFVGGTDESWKNYSSGEQYGPTFFTSIQRDLPVGKHRILIGGRSARFAIDTVGLKLIRSGNVTTPVATAPPVASPTAPVTPSQPDVLPPVAGTCAAQGASLANAKSNYAKSCPRLARKDCDPIGKGQWVCSSEKIINGVTPVVNAPNPPATPAPTPAPVEPKNPVATGDCSAQGSSLAQAKANYARSCPTLARQDCDPIGGSWLCSSGNIGNTNSPVASKPTPVDTPPAPTGSGTIGRFSANDLLALHYDNCPDRDDGHAIVSAKAVLDKVNLQNTIVVNGTCGASIRNRYQPSSVNVLRAVWGSNWLDSFNRESSAVATSADRWAATLANGDDVWVAEGGPSDFTAKVLRRIGQIYPSANRKRVRVIQHSAGQNFNERLTSAAGIRLVKQVADYRAIPDGNKPNNGSADLNTKSASFLNIARQSRYSNEWDVAFDYLDPDVKLDFSDTVELLYIINDTQTLTVNDFANRYLR
ncbi:MAG: hypothetical protein AB8B64_06590 [Granulosicoccus sp.]